MSERMTAFSYDGSPPPEYTCGTCNATGVRLYRDYQTMARETRLLCTACAEEAGLNHQKVDPDRPDSLGWFVAAVPTEDGDTFWGFTSVPWRGCYWWHALPTVAGVPQPAEALTQWLKRTVAGLTFLTDSYGKSLQSAHQKAAECTELRADLVRALESLRTPGKRKDCWCSPSRDIEAHGHENRCINALAAIVCAGALK